MSELKFDLEQEKQKIVDFLRRTFKKQNIDRAVIGLSGGIDSTVSFFLLKEVLSPQNIIVAHLYYYNSDFSKINSVVREAKIPQNNIHLLSIKSVVDEIAKLQQVEKNEFEKVRIGNIASRMRMIILFDLAKKHNALVVGTENKTENLLGYFTRFGDQASDIEPIEHLYKTQVLQLAKYLGISESLISQKPTAGLWQGQTDEGDFGFSYAEADQVLFLSLEKGLMVEEIEKQGYKNAREILSRHKKNIFKHKTPYILK